MSKMIAVVHEYLLNNLQKERQVLFHPEFRILLCSIIITILLLITNLK